MHYYQFNIADYKKDTSHLTTLEHGIYRQLLDIYYLDEKPIPKETQWVIRRLRLGSDSDILALNNVLSDFFTLENDGYHQARCDADILAYHANAEKNRANGKKGGRPKKEIKQEESITCKNEEETENPEKTHWVILANPNETQTKGNHKPITNNHKPITKDNTQSQAIDAPTKKKVRIDWDWSSRLVERFGISEQIANDFIINRKAKNAPITETVLKQFSKQVKQVNEAGVYLGEKEAFAFWTEKQWQGFTAEWYLNSKKSSGAETQNLSIEQESQRLIDDYNRRHGLNGSKQPHGAIIEHGQYEALEYPF